jgi:hypothetical protein
MWSLDSEGGEHTGYTLPHKAIFHMMNPSTFDEGFETMNARDSRTSMQRYNGITKISE